MRKVSRLSPLCHSIRGFTLVELMIAITLGLLIMAALTVMYVNRSSIRRELDKNNRMTDNGRYAIQMLSENVRHAGFYGEYDPSAQAVPVVMDPCSTANLFSALKLPVQAIHAANFTSAADLSGTSCGIASSMIKPGSDVIVVRRVDTSVTPLGSATNGYYLQTSLCESDTEKAKLSAANSNALLTLHAKPAVGTTTCTTLNSETRRLIVQIYFVSSYNVPGDGIPTLKRLELMPTGTPSPAGTLLPNGSVSTGGALATAGFVLTPLVEGVEFMRIDYGIDSNNADGFGQADSYTSAPACPVTGSGSCAETANIVDAKIYLLVRNPEGTAGYQDQKRYQMGLSGELASSSLDTSFRRQVYTQYVRLTNAAARRETP